MTESQYSCISNSALKLQISTTNNQQIKSLQETWQRHENRVPVNVGLPFLNICRHLVVEKITTETQLKNKKILPSFKDYEAKTAASLILLDIFYSSFKGFLTDPQTIPDLNFPEFFSVCKFVYIRRFSRD